jgi:hypothetical protein
MSDEQDAPQAFHFKVGGDDVDFSNITPITVGDKKKLKLEGIDFMKYARERALDPEDEAKMLLYLIRKRRPATTLEEVDEIPVLIASSFVQFVMKRATEIDDPFSTRSTSLGRPTAGASATSSSEPSTN